MQKSYYFFYIKLTPKAYDFVLQKMYFGKSILMPIIF